MAEIELHARTGVRSKRHASQGKVWKRPPTLLCRGRRQ